MPILLLTALGAVLRFVAIGHQGFWYDEAYTVYLVGHSPGRMLGLLPHVESTPPLYYCVAWVWSRIFGFGPAGLKSLSAVCGTLMIPVAYAAGCKMLANRRSALIVAALTACNPFLIWYSQEARAYSMLALLCACSVLAFAYARERPRTLPLTLWAVASALALLTHYYAVIVLIPEAVWLLYEHRHSRPVQLGIAGVALVGFALLPLAITQDGTHNNRWIAHSSYWLRLKQILPLFLIGPETHARILLKFLAFAMVAVALALLIWRSRRRERQAAWLPGGIALVGFLLGAGPGHNTLLGRNLLPLWLPTALFLGSGLGAARARLLGVVATVVLCAIGITAVISVDTTTAFQRPRWQLVADAIGQWPTAAATAKDARIVVVQDNPGGFPLGLYLKDLRYIETDTIRNVVEIDVIAVTPHRALGGFCWWGSECNLISSRLDRRYSRLRGFHPVRRIRAGDFQILELRSAKPRSVARTELPMPRRHEEKHFVQSGHSPLHDAQLVEQS
ncbi:MAG TPA: glycosyltransferase family 39 protein [Solirubrobacteraceae bacterium]|nr:glycosyltransferase family 39 protein [Solirubrobacteraceae bacterium]